MIGVWYGKNPGLDRAMDALRHANFAGTHPKGGALALVGDDPSCKCSTLPSAGEATLASLHMPTFFPGTLQEVLDFGRHAIACSRASGLWSALKIVTNVADAAGTAQVWPDRVVPLTPRVEWQGRPYVHQPNGHLLAPQSLELEKTLFGPRLELATQYGRLNHLNPITLPTQDAWLGIVAAGKVYYELLQALNDLGLDQAALERAGIRLMKVGMLYPHDRDAFRDFGRGLDEILVVEEKLPYLETAIKDALYGTADAPRITGKHDPDGRDLLSPESDLDADAIALAVARRLEQPRPPRQRPRARRDDQGAPRRDDEDRPARRPHAVLLLRLPAQHLDRQPRRHAARRRQIGCHTMVLLAPEGKGEVTGITQMGGEGAQFAGMQPFTDADHFVQNLGDGTFHHSGSLAIRFAAAAGVNVTYKLLYNDTVAMTGGQDVLGQLKVPELTRWLALEGVKQIVVTTDEPEKYDGVELDPIANVRHRDDLAEAQAELAAIEGVTVLIHDQGCAAEKRRLRKRGKVADPIERIHINERVCEGCGDCGEKSSCLSVLPVETEFGRKTQIHQASCNKDYSCVKGDCPSFLTVIPGKKAKKTAPEPPADLPEPALRVPHRDFLVRMAGVGGTGVVTVSQILQMAALLDGKHAYGLDQTGLAQKGGPVISDVRISRDRIEGSNKATAGAADLHPRLRRPRRRQPEEPARRRRRSGPSPSSTPPPSRPRRWSRTRRSRSRPSGATSPPSSAARARRRTSTSTPRRSPRASSATTCRRTCCCSAPPTSTAACPSRPTRSSRRSASTAPPSTSRWPPSAGAAPPSRTPTSSTTCSNPTAPEPVVDGKALEDPRGHRRDRRAAPPARGPHPRARRLPEREVRARVRRRRSWRSPTRDTAVAEAYARGLHKLMAYKDEYEVARLHLDPVERAKVDAGVRRGREGLLHAPPAAAARARAEAQAQARPVVHAGVPDAARDAPPARHAARRLRLRRGPPRRAPRSSASTATLVERALDELRPETHATVAKIAALPDVVRGYEDIKLRNVERFRAEAEQARARAARGPEGAREAAPARAAGRPGLELADDVRPGLDAPPGDEPLADVGVDRRERLGVAGLAEDDERARRRVAGRAAGDDAAVLDPLADQLEVRRTVRRARSTMSST